jgi:TonB family protein
MRITFAFVCVTLLAQNAVGQSSVKQELTSALVGKAMLLKSTCRNNQLSVNAQGTQIEDCVQGPWTVHSLFYIQNVKLSDKSLEISGVREVDAVIAAGSQAGSNDRPSLAFPDLDRLVIAFQLPSSLADMASANTLLAKVFASPAERQEELALYLAPGSAPTGNEQDRVGMLGPDRPVYKAGQRGVRPPVVIHSELPEYSDAGRDARISGAIWMLVVVNERGVAERIQVTRRLGFGLEEKALAAVAGWKFRPGQKDGRPVAVEISTEVEFHR